MQTTAYTVQARDYTKKIVHTTVFNACAEHSVHVTSGRLGLVTGQVASAEPCFLCTALAGS